VQMLEVHQELRGRVERHDSASVLF
jgi:hypothetical protein